MAGTFTIKLLAQGQLPNAKGTLYTTPASTQTIIKTITLVNTDIIAENVNLYIKDSAGTSKSIIPVDCVLGIKYLLETDQEYTLEAGDLIEGDANTAAKVDYTINGIEES